MSAPGTTQAFLNEEGQLIERLPDGSTRPIEDRTDWQRVNALTDEEIEKAAASDPDTRMLTARDFETAYRHPAKVDVKAIRQSLRMSQRAFCRKYGFSADAVQQWEQGRREPNRYAKLLLTIIQREPDAVDRVLRAWPEKK